MTSASLDDARALANSDRLYASAEYERATLRVLLAILDKLSASSPANVGDAEPTHPPRAAGHGDGIQIGGKRRGR